MKEAQKTAILAIIGLFVLMGAVLVLTGKVNLSALPNFNYQLQGGKTGMTYFINAPSWCCAYPPAVGTNAYYGFAVTDVKVDGVSRTWAYPTSIVGSLGTKPVQVDIVPQSYYGTQRNIEVLIFSNTSAGAEQWENFHLFNYDTSAFTGNHTIEIDYAYAQGACYSQAYGDCVGKLTTNYYTWGTYQFKDTFTNAGPNVTVCGNSQCETGEDYQNCPVDCHQVPVPVCGDQSCNGAETCSTCPSDCGACSSGQVCGDHVCNGQETCATCPGDCGTCAITPPQTAQDNTVLYVLIGVVVLGAGYVLVTSRKK